MHLSYFCGLIKEYSEPFIGMAFWILPSESLCRADIIITWRHALQFFTSRNVASLGFQSQVENRGLDP